MTESSLHEYLVHGSLFAVAPVVGTYFTSPSGSSVFLLNKMRQVRGAQDGLSYRLIGVRLRRAELPAEATVVPWPRRAIGRPRKAAEPPAPTERAVIITRQQAASAERKRVIGISKQHRDPANLLAEPVRLENQTLESVEIRDISDVNPNRRTPKMVKTFRALTVVDQLFRAGTITRAHAGAARMFRNQYERSAGLGLGQVDIGAPKVISGSTAAGISEMQLFALDGQRVVKTLLRGLYPMILAVCALDVSLKEFARRSRISPSVCAGRLSAALEILAGHFNSSEPAEKIRNTINTGQWNRPPED